MSITSQQQKQLQALLEVYAKHENVELEFRVVVKDYKLYTELYNVLLKDYTPTIEKSINALSEVVIPSVNRSPNKRNVKQRVPYNIRTIIFKGNSSENIYSQKTPMMAPIQIKGSLDYKIALSKEEVQDKPFKSSTAKLMRIKLRSSFVIKDWRYDFTFVGTVKNNFGEGIPKYQKLLHPAKVTPKSFIELFDNPSDNSITYELEIEHVGSDHSNPELQDEITTILDPIFETIDPGYKEKETYQQEVYNIAQWLKPQNRSAFRAEYGLKQLGNQVIGLDKRTYIKDILPNIENFYASVKIDGDRCIMIIDKTTVNIVSGRLNVATLSTIATKNITSTTIFDGEILYDNPKDKDNSKYKLYIFDVMVWNGKNLTNDQFHKRLAYIPKAIELFKGNVEKISVESQEFVKLSQKQFGKELATLYKKKQSYPEDGIIFTPSEEKETKGNYIRMKIYKWKPLDENSIDFLMKKVPKELHGRPPYVCKSNEELYILFSGIAYNVFKNLSLEYIERYRDIFDSKNIQRQPYFPIQFTPSNYEHAYIYKHPTGSKDPYKGEILDGRVGEFRHSSYDWKTRKGKQSEEPLTLSNEKWEMLRIREDKDVEAKRGNYFGNDFLVAEMTWQNYFNPLTLQVLTNPEVSDYFAEESSQLYKAQRGFNSFVKGALLQQSKGVNWIVDMAAGKGQDMFRIDKLNVKNALFIDIDAAALNELVNRRLESVKAKQHAKQDFKSNNMSVHVLQADLSQPFEKTLTAISEFKIPMTENVISKQKMHKETSAIAAIQLAGGKQFLADMVICNFAIHYLLPNPDALRNLIKLVYSLLKPNGVFVFTCFDGETVFDLLGDKLEWESKENDLLKYSIRKHYKGSEFLPTGQVISVMHPFSHGKYYEENLVNLDYVLDQFEKNGFSREQQSSFKSMLPKFADANPKVFKMMTNEDKKYVGLYSYASVRKTKGGGRKR